ncbi:hypothetical protein diail_8305, partial [Diaporthe ilicicola]
MSSQEEIRLQRLRKGATATPPSPGAARPSDNDSKQETPGERAAGATWKHLFVFTQRRQAGFLSLAIVASLLVAAVKTVFAILLGKIMDFVSPLGAGSIDGSTAMAGVTTWCVVLTGIGVASWAFSSALMALWIIFGELVAETARKCVFEHLMEKEMAWFDGQDEGLSSALSGMQIQIRELQMATSQVLGFLISDIFVAIGCLIVAFYNSWQLTLVLMATIPVSVTALHLIGRGLETAIDLQKRELAQASKAVIAAVTGIDLVKIYNGFDHEVWQYLQLAKEAMRYYLQQALRNAIQMGFLKLWMVNLFVIGFWFAGYLVSKGSTTPGTALTTFYSILAAFQSIESIGPQWLVLAKGMSAGHHLQKIVLARPEYRNTHGMKGSRQPRRCAGEIELHDVSFAYPSNPGKTVLNRSSFIFRSGGLTFLVGKSGSGKSTIANLLLKFYEPLTGSILIDAQPIQALDDTWLRENVTLIQQSSILFNDTFFMNVAFGSRNPFAVTSEEVRAACETVLLQSTVANLPERLDTTVGVGGYNLSGGQRQRLALARARLRDPPVLILDEVTSGLDPISRVLILEAIRIWRAGKTTIIITHDVSQILNEDYVYVLDQSYLVQQGFRRDLVKDEDGVFASLLSSTEDGPAGGSSASLDSAGSNISAFSSCESLGEMPPTENSRFSRVFLHPQAPSSTGSRGLFRLSLGASVERSTVMRARELWDAPPRPAEPSQGRASYPYLSPESPITQIPPREPIRYLRDTNNFGYTQQRMRKSSLDMVQESGEMTKSRRPLVKTPRAEQKSGWQSSERTEPRGSDFRPPCEETRGAREQRRQHAGKPVAVGAGRDLSLVKILATVWPVLDKINRIRLILGLVACIVAAVCNPAFSYVFARLIAAFWAPPAEMRGAGQTWAVRLTIIGAVDGCATFGAFYLLQYAGQAWVTSLRVEALKRVLSQPRHWFDRPTHSPDRIVEVLDRNAEEMRNLVGRFVPIILIVVTMMISGLIWALVISWKLTLVTLSSAPAVYAATQAIAHVSGKWEARCNAMAETTGSVSVETFVNIRVVRALTLEHHFRSKHVQSTESTFRVGVERGLWTGLFYGFNQGMPDWLTALVFWYATVLLTSPGATISASDIIQVINLLLFSIGTATSMLDSIPQISQAKATSIQVLYYATLSYSNSHEGRGEKRVLTPFPIEMKSLQFAYPAAKASEEGPNKVLRNVNLRIDRGDCVGIVGASGCGKSTIASLLLRLYEPSVDQPLGENMQSHALHRPDAGEPDQQPPALSYAHIPASDVSTSILRAHTAYVPQHPFLFPTTIRENIVYGLHADSPFRELSSVVAAARQAWIHDFIVSLPDGYATLVGEGGLGLSGGQAQRVSIARALVRKPKLLVMDEPTSALDAGGAEGVRKAIQDLMQQGRQAREGEELTVVTITHAKEMMRIVSRLVVMDEGFVAEEGGFEELLAKRGKLAELLGGGAWIGPDSKAAGAKRLPSGPLIGAQSFGRQVHGNQSDGAPTGSSSQGQEMKAEGSWRLGMTPVASSTPDSLVARDGTFTAREEALQRLADLTFDTPLPPPNTAHACASPTVDAPAQPTLGAYTNPTRWSTHRKAYHMVLCCVATLLTAYCAGSYSPPVAIMQAEFHASRAAVSAGITTFCVGFALAPMVLAPFSEINGRYPVFSISGVVFVVFQVACGFVTNLAGMLACRFLVGVGGSVFSTMIGGIIADLWEKEGRNTPMAVFSGSVLVGTGLGPLVASVMTSRLADDGDAWRWVFWHQAIAGGVLVTLIAILFKESRGSIVLSRKAKALNQWYEAREEAGYYGVWLQTEPEPSRRVEGPASEGGNTGAATGPEDGEKRTTVAPTHPNTRTVAVVRLRWLVRSDSERVTVGRMISVSLYRPFHLLWTEPVVFWFSAWVSFAWAVLYLTFSSVPYVFETVYGWDSESTGYVFAAIMIGGVLSTIIGILQDDLLKHPQWRAENWVTDDSSCEQPSGRSRMATARLYAVLRRHFPVEAPESRLYFTCLTATLLPIGLFIFGFTSRETVHWISPAIALCLASMGIFSVYLATFNYLADVYQTYASSALAAQSCCRNLLGGIFPLVTLPLFENLGVARAGALLGGIALGLTFVP